MVKFLQPSGLLKIAICAAVMGFSFSESAYAVSTPVARVNSIGATITPAEGSYTSLQEFTVTFPAGSEVAFDETAFRNGTVPALKGTASNGTAVTQSMAAVGYSTDGNVMKFKCGYSELATIGEYTLTIPAACYTINGETGVELTFDYKVIASEAVQEYVVTPAAGEVSDLSSIELKFNNVLSITACPENGNNYAQLNFYNTKIHGGEWCEVVVDNENIISANSLVLHAQEQLYSGQYRVVVPAGSYYLDGVENEAISIDYQLTVPEQDYAVILPAEGVVEALSNFTIEFPAATTVETAFERDACPVLYNLTTDNEEFSFTTATIDGNKMTLKLNQDIAVAGSYELRIPAACYLLDNVYGNALTFSYTIGTSDKTIEYSIAPEAGEDGTVSTISPIVVSFDNAAKVEENPNANYYTQYALVEYQGKSREDWEEAEIETQIQSNVLLYFLSEADTKDVTDRVYRLTIPAGTYLVDGVENPEIVQEFHYVVPQQDYAVVLPAEGEVEALQNFEIEFPGVTTIATVDINATVAPALVGPAGDEPHTYYATAVKVDGNKLSFSTQSAAVGYGEFTLTVPGALYTLDGVQGQDLTFNYTIVKSEKTVAYSITPVADEDGNVSTISPIVVTFDNATKVEANPNADIWSQYAIVEYQGKSREDWEEAVITEQIQSKSILYFIDEADTKDVTDRVYRLTVPAGTYLVDDVESPEIVQEFHYVVPQQDKFVALPAAGEVEGLQSFEIEFPAATTVEAAFSREAYPVLYNVTDGHNEFSFMNAEVNGNKMTLSTNAAVAYMGDYELRIPAGCYKLDGEDGEAITLAYTVVQSDKTFEYTITPADQSTIESFSSVVVTFPNIRKIELDDSEVYPYFEFYDAQWYDWSQVDVYYETSANQLVITLPSWTTLESAQYNVVIPANFIIGDGITYNKEILSTFVLEQAVPEFTTVIDPAEGVVASLKSFNILFEGIDKFEVNNYTSTTKYYIEKEDGSKVYPSDSFINYDAEGSPLYIEFAEITEAGKYTLVLPEGSYKVNGISGNELRFEYTVDNTDAVSSIFVNGVDSVDVYDLRGVRVLNNAKAADLRNLNTNVYIINGQKYLLRK